MSALSETDASQRFLFADADIRGESVVLDTALQQVLARHDYSATVRALLGEFAAAVVLISNNLKYRGRITLQARSSESLSLVMVECTSDLQIRGIARGQLDAVAAAPLDLLRGGQLVITMEREQNQRYQGIVALDSGSLAGALEDYFQQSEQLHTRFWLAATTERAAGMMLQQLPAQRRQSAEAREDQWQTACVLADTVTPTEQLELPPATLLHRLFHETPVRIFEPRPVMFGCPCSRERSLNALSLLPEAEQAELLAEQGCITMDCEICGAQYRFVQTDIPALAEKGRVH